MPLTYGLDIGGTSLKVGAWDASGDVLERRAWRAGIPTPQSADTDPVLTEITAVLSGFMAEVGDPPAALGIGSCGLIARGEILQSPNTPWDYLPLERYLGAALSCPVHLLNDADAFLLGAMETRGKLPASAIGITLGTGIGTSIWLDGRILLGGSGISPEAGHITLNCDGAVGTAGIPGTWEVLAGRDALLRYYREAGGGEASEALPVAEAAAKGDTAALAAWRRYGEAVGIGLGTLVNIFSPEEILIGGGLAGAHQHFEGAMHAALRRHSLASMPGPQVSWVREQPDTVALGAARWARMKASGRGSGSET